MKVLKLIFVKIPIWFVMLSVAAVFVLKWVPISYTPLMLKRAFEYKEDANYSRYHKWVSIESVPKEVIKVVLAAEDSRFFLHNGFEAGEIKVELERFRNGEKHIRGCSTISQQTAKNVFTSGSHTWLRKGVEAYYTFLIENIWGKSRILEVYLNVVELGKGIYGLGVASEMYFGKEVKDLSIDQAASLAVCLPNPLKRNPKKVGDRLMKQKSRIIQDAKYISNVTP